MTRRRLIGWLCVFGLMGEPSVWGADFVLLTGTDPPALQGQVHGRAPIAWVEGRLAAQFGAEGWVSLPTAGNFDPHRGGLDIVVCPSWSPEDTARHTLFHVGENDAQSHFTVFKTENPTLRFVVKRDPAAFAAIDAPIGDWKAGEWHRIRASWIAAADGLVMLLQLDDGPVLSNLSAKPLEKVPEQCYIGRRGPVPQFADAAIAQLRLTSEPILTPPMHVGRLEPAKATIDAGRTVGPVRRVYDCTTIWNHRNYPLPFSVGDAKWQRFKEAEFSLARLVAVSETWLWGVKVERNAAGRIELDFSDFDKLIDTVRAAGAEPYVRFAYHMPRVLSSQPDSANWGYSPPRDPKEWEELIAAIVRHLNVERKVGVKYFVCTLNEADIAIEKYGAKWQDMLELYQRTVRAAKAVDPTIKVGGPAICKPLDGLGGQCLREFVEFCRERSLPIDFICFHRYRAGHPMEYEQHLHTIQQIVREANPRLRPEWFCDEYNLWARDHRADDEYGAAYLAAAIQYLKRGGLDKLSLVSFNDIVQWGSQPGGFVYNEEAIGRTSGLPLIKGTVVTAPYFAVLMHNKLRGNELGVSLDGTGGILGDNCLGVTAAGDGEAVRALVWSFSPLGEGDREVTLRFENLPERIAQAGQARLKRWLIDATHTNPWYEYVVRGKPAGELYNLVTGELDQVEDKTVPVRDSSLEVAFRLDKLGVTAVEVAGT